MAPIWDRTRPWISLKTSSATMAEVGWLGSESVMKAKGSWPLRESAMPTTQHSATFGEEEIACSMEPVLVSLILIGS